MSMPRRGFPFEALLDHDALLVAALQGATSLSPLATLQSAVPIRPLQNIESQLPVRPFQSLQGRPGIAWLQNSRPVNAIQSAALTIAVDESGPRDQLLDALAENAAPPATSRRRRRSLDSDVLADDMLSDAAEEMASAPAEKVSSRQEKALQYLNMDGYLAVNPMVQQGEFSPLDLDEAGLTLADEEGNELLSRAAPFRHRNQPDSPIYYIRLPPSPYVLVPGVGYVSSPNRRPLGGMASMAAAAPPPPPQSAGGSPFYNLPLAFMSNGKPTGVYQPSWGPSAQPMAQPQRPVRPARPPQQQAAMFSLNKGPYVFNGRPSDIFILRDSYDTLYGDALSSFYP
ncbi:uncharacterized protein LOC117649569 [Thrips palmi]|uniref:Uncharacterized protein LOC117649569 n=1 Tax=Thrips palmi TaxID=161013 RepID=A0A6P8ZSZ4_THRPL|nr:uncharacterized protein LOC117649569 [Thrips palmi]